MLLIWNYNLIFAFFHNYLFLCKYINFTLVVIINMHFFSYFHSLNYDKFIDLFSTLHPRFRHRFVSSSAFLSIENQTHMTPIVHTSSPSANPPGKQAVSEFPRAEFNCAGFKECMYIFKKTYWIWMNGGQEWWILPSRGAAAAGGVDIDI